MKNYNLTLISGSDYTVANMTATGFNKLFFTAGGEAQFTPDSNSAGNITIWDSADKTGKSISATTSVEAGKPYVGSWESSEQTTNTFTTFEDAKAYGLTRFQLSQMLKGEIKELTYDKYPNDYPANNPDGIALWKLPSGLYHSPGRKVYMGSGVSGSGPSSWLNDNNAYHFMITSLLQPGGTQYSVSIIRFGNTSQVAYFSGSYYPANPNSFTTSVTNWAMWRNSDCVANNLTTTDSTVPKALDARQGKVLNETKLSIANLEVGEGLKITTTGSGANTKIKIELDSNDETEY